MTSRSQLSAALRNRISALSTWRQVGIFLVLLAASCHEYTKRVNAANWNNTAGGNFTNPSNWQGGITPGPSDTAVFNLGLNTYSVVLGQDWATRTLQVGSNLVTLDLASHTLTTKNVPSSTRSIFVGGTIFSTLKLLNGTLLGSGMIVGSAAATSLNTLDLGPFASIELTESDSGELVVVGGAGTNNQSLVRASQSSIIVGQSGAWIGGDPANGNHGPGTVELTNQSLFASGGDIHLGPYGGSGTLSVASGSTVTSSRGFIGDSSTGVGTATISGTGSLWEADEISVAGNLSAVTGSAGRSSLKVQSGGALHTSHLNVQADAIVQGTGSSLQATAMTVAAGGKLEITSKAVAEVGNGLVEPPGVAPITVEGTLVVDNAQLTATSSTDFFGSVTVDHAASVAFHFDRTPVNSSHLGLYGTWDVKNSSTVEVDDGDFYITGGTLNVMNASVRVTWLGTLIGGAALSVGSGKVTLTDNASLITNGQSSIGEDESEAVLTIASGSKLVSTPYLSPSQSAAILGRFSGSHGRAIVEGAGSLWDCETGFIVVGSSGMGELQILSGGMVKSLAGRIGWRAVGTGNALVEGSGSTWEISQSLFVGGDEVTAGGVGKLQVKDHGVTQINSELRVWQNGTVEIDETSIVTVGDAGIDPTAGALTVGLGGKLTGMGKIIGDVIVAGGTLSPGASPGVLTIEGNLTNNGQLQLDLGADGFDQLQVSGNVALGGVLQLLQTESFQPAIDDQFRVLNAATVSGRFSQLSGYVIDEQLQLAPFLDPTGVTLRVVLSGDATLDHKVDGADYVSWADNFLSTTATYLQGDFNNDGVVDGVDYTVWADHFLVTASPSLTISTVPEPSTLALAVVAALGLGGHRWWSGRSFQRNAKRD